MIDLRPLIPHCLIIGLGILVVLLDALRVRRNACCLGFVTALGAVAAIALDWVGPDARLWAGQIVADPYSRAFDTIFLAVLAVVALASASDESHIAFAGEYYALLCFATVGLMITASAGSLLILYVGIELSTICLMALVGFAKRDRRSSEAAVKFFVLGAVGSALMLYGCSIIFGLAGGTEYGKVLSVLSGVGGFPALLWLGFGFVVAGLGFKIAAVPFHMWAPDVYQGAPTTITAFMSTASKVGGFAALLRFLLVALGAAPDRWAPVIVALSAASIVLGNLLAVAQTNLKRMLAYSGISQAGYLLVAVAGASAADSGLAVGAVVMYGMLYGFMNVGAFLVAQVIEDHTGSGEISALKGLHRRQPLLALAMLLFLFSLGGIPPLAGFVGKLYLFAAGWEGGRFALVGLGAVASVIALYYYLMVALQVYIKDPDDDTRIPVSRQVSLAVAICVMATLAIGVYPKPLVQLGDRAAAALHTYAAPRPLSDIPTSRRP